MANEFVVRNGLLALDNSVISGSLTVTGGITGSFSGTGSYAAFALSSSNSLTSSFAFQAANASNAVSASFATVAANASSASFATNASTAASASFATNASTAASASFATNASTAASASYATNAGNAGSASFATQAANASSASSAINAVTASYTQLAASASYALSSSYALNASTATSASYATNAGTAGSASFASQAANASSASYAATASYAYFGISSSFASNAANASSASSATFASTASLAQSLTPGTIVSASNVFVSNNLVVNGTASFSYLQTVSGSAVVIGEEYIVLNTQSPVSRFAGLLINDSGSNSTASIVWDSERNHFVYTNASGSTYSGGGFMSGPRNTGSLGSEPYPTLNRVVRGQGGDHLYDSNITDNDTNIILGINTQITGTLGVTGTITGNLTGTSSFATTASYAGNASNATSASFATSAANATTASHAVNAVTASRALNANTASYATFAATATSASFATQAANASSASYALVTSTATSASYATFANTASSANDFIVRGSVGIGTISPLTKLHISGSSPHVLISGKFDTSSADHSRIYFNDYNFGIGAGKWTSGEGGTDDDLYLWSFNGTGRDIRFAVTTDGSTAVTSSNWTTNMIIKSSTGNVGIGTLTPATKVHNVGYYTSDVGGNGVEGGYYLGNSAHGLRRPGGSSNDVYLYTTNGNIYVGTTGASSQQIVLLNNGNVGIGTTAPLSPLHVSRGGGSVDTITMAGDVGFNVGFGIRKGADQKWAVYSDGSDTFHIYSGVLTSNLVSISSGSGNVGINQIAPAYKLDVTGVIRATSYFISAPNTTVAGGGPYDWIYLGAADTTASRASAVQIGDISGAKYAIMGGSYDLTFAKHVSSSNTWANAFTIIGDTGNDAAPNVYFVNNIGIGSNSPAYKLEVIGTARISSNTIISGSKIGFENSTAGAVFGATTISNTQSTTGVTIGRYLGDYGFIDIASQNSNGGWIDFSSGSGDDYQGRIRYWNADKSMYFYTNTSGTALLTLGATSVGIGTTSPSRGLTINRTNELAALNIIKNNTGNQIAYLGTGGSSAEDLGILQLSDGGVVKAQIYTSGVSYFNGGNVGINSTVPAYTLDVNGPLRVNDTIYFRGTLIDEAANEASYTWLRIQPSSGDKAGVFQIGPSGTSKAGGVIELYPSSSFNTALRHVIANSGSNAVLKIGSDTSALPIQFLSSNSPTITILGNGNVGIGEINPTSVLFTKNAGITAQNTYLGTGQLRVGGGSDHGANTVLSVAPGVVVVDAPGIVGGRFVIDSNGNIGINSPNPSYKLDVAGTVRVTGSNPSFRTDSTTDYTSLASYKSGNRIWQLDSVGSEFRVYYDAASAYMFTMSGSRGFIGIGTTIPVQELHVYSATENADIRLMGSGQSSVYLDVYYGSTGGGLFGYGSQDIKIGHSGTGDHTYFKSNGSIGIGTTAPEQRLHVAGQLILKSSGEGGPYIYRDGDNAGDVRFYSTNGTFAAPTAKSATGLLGQIHYAGYDGSSYITTAQIWASVDGAVSTNVVPSRLEFKTAATNTPSVQMVIKSNGNVGIGSSLPAFRLDVNGGIRTNGSDILLRNSDTESSNIQIGNMVTQYPYKRVDSFSHDGTGYFWGFGRRTGATQQINAFWVGSTRDFNIADGLNIIGWTANEFNGSYPSYVTNARIAGSGVSYFNGGNVGIGQTTAPHKLVINGDSTVADATTNNAAVNIISSTVNRTAIRFHQYGQVEYTIGVDTHSTSGNFRIVNTNGPINLTGSSLGFIMNSSGCIGIGTVPSSQKFHVIGAVVGGATATAGAPNTTGVTTQLAFEARSTSAGNEPSISYHKEGVYTMYLQGQNSGRGLRLYSPSSETTANFYCQGDVVAYNSSDKRLKDNLTLIPNAIEKVSKLGGYSFDWNDKQDVYKGHDYGVVAQEVEEVFPELVETRQDGYKAVKYDKLTAVLIEAIKEQQKQIDELKYLLQTQNK